MATAGVLALPAFANSSGDENGQPFQELQEAVDAAVAAEAAAREAADDALEAAIDAEETARIAGDSAEAAARAAEDAALSAAIMAEEQARIAADQALQAELDTQALLLEGIDDRVSILEGLHFGRAVTWTETSAFDVVDLAAAIAGLNVAIGDWILVAGTRARTGQQWAICTNHPAAKAWLDNAASGAGSYNGVASAYIGVGGTNWYAGYSVRLFGAALSSAQVIRVDYPYNGIPTYTSYVADRYGNTSAIDSELYVRYGGGGEYWPGNEITINVATDRLTACGF